MIFVLKRNEKITRKIKYDIMKKRGATSCMTYKIKVFYTMNEWCSRLFAHIREVTSGFKGTEIKKENEVNVFYFYAQQNLLYTRTFFVSRSKFFPTNRCALSEGEFCVL